MHKELLNYLSDIESDTFNFELGLWYEKNEHLSPATSFYLRCAELTEDVDLIYECLLRLYFCYKNLSNRDYTCENLLKNALEVGPKKPEAYVLLSQFYENKKNWLDSYLFACLGLEVSNKLPSKLKVEVGYSSEYVIIFQKAVAAWWVGKPSEARKLFRKLKNEYKDQMREDHLNLVQSNLLSLGAGSDSESSVRYFKGKNDLRFNFNSSEAIVRNFSQVCQDLFVLTVLDGKRDGSYLEIGAGHPFHNNNTALLEQFGWTGVGIELRNDMANAHKESRRNNVICTNALNIDYKQLLEENFKSNIIDYLQVDIEPSKNTFEALVSLPLDKYQFRVITYEHDHYVDIDGTFREKSRRYLKAFGYKLVVSDVAAIDGCNFEDWWVKEELVDAGKVKSILELSNKEINLVKEIFFV